MPRVVIAGAAPHLRAKRLACEISAGAHIEAQLIEHRRGHAAQPGHAAAKMQGRVHALSTRCKAVLVGDATIEISSSGESPPQRAEDSPREGACRRRWCER